MIVNTLPVTMSTIAVKSYFQMNTSPRNAIESNAPARIAVAELAVNSVMSAKGRTTKLVQIR